jgi:N-acetylneuraminic acid mutarotase
VVEEMSCNGADVPPGAMMDAKPILLAYTNSLYAMSELTRCPDDSIFAGTSHSLISGRTIAGKRSNDRWNDASHSSSRTSAAQMLRAQKGVAGGVFAGVAVNRVLTGGAGRSKAATHPVRAKEVYCHAHC